MEDLCNIQTVIVPDKKALIEALAAKLKLGQSLFTRHVVCLPDLKWKKQIVDDILSSQVIAAIIGVEFELLPKLLFSLCGKARAQPVRIPPKDILALHLLPLLSREKQLDLPEDEAARQLRLKMLSYQLAEQMITLGKFGGSGLETFLKEDTMGTRLFKKVFSFWDYPYKCLKHDLSVGVKQPFYLHLLAHSFIPSVYQKLIKTLGPDVRIIYYQFSYCHAFWTDVVSDSGAINLQSAALKKGALVAPVQQLQSYLMDRNPLLANLGQLHLKAKKEFESFLEEKPEEQIPLAMTNLAALKQDILSNTQGEKALKSDTSLAAFKCKSRREEVMLLREKIEILLSSGPGITPKDITVYAPDMALYSPLIQEEFAKDMALPVLFFDEKHLDKSPFFQAVRALLVTFSKRVTYKSFFNFFSLPAVSQAFGIAEEDVAFFAHLLEEANFVEELGPEGFDEGAKTFAAAVQRLLLSSLFISENQPLFQNTFLGKSALSKLAYFAHNVMELIEKVKTFFVKEHTALSFYNGLIDLIAIFGSLEDLGAEGAHLKSVLELLKTLDEPLDGAKLRTRDLIEYVLKSFDQTSALSVGGNLNVIIARNFNINTYYPSKAVFVLGMDQDSFPRKVTIDTKPYYEDFIPSSAQEDRAAFLSLLLQTEASVHLSFASYCEKENAELLQTPLISMLNDYLGPLGVQEYVGSSTPLLAPAFSDFLLSFKRPCCSIKAVENRTLMLDLETLRRFCKHPVRFFFHQRGMRLPFKSSGSGERVPLKVKRKQQAQNSAQQWQASLEEAHLAGFFPGGLYGELSDEEISGQRQLFIKELQDIGVSPSELFSLKLEAKNTGFFVDDSHVITGPACEVFLEENGFTLTVEGTFSHLCKKGLIIHADFSLANVVKHMADLAIFFSIGTSLHFEKKVWFLSPSTTQSIQREKEDFYPFFKWFLEQRGSWFPMLPKFASLFEKQDVHGLKKELEQVLLMRSDPYLTHGLTTVDKNQIEEMVSHGHRIVESVFKKVANHA